MNLPSVLAVAFLATASHLFCQTTRGKPKPLASQDKTFVKNSTESIFYLTSLAGRVRITAKDVVLPETTTTLGKKIGSEFGKLWGEIGAIASDAGEELPTALKGSDKTKVASLGKLKQDKFEKEFAELSAKEAKQLVGILENGSKMAQHAELKAIAERWIPAVKGIAEEAAALSKTSGKH